MLFTDTQNVTLFDFFYQREAWEQWGQLFHAFWFDDQVFKNYSK